MAVLQAANVGAVFGAGEQALGQIYAGDLNVRIALGETAGVKAGTTSNFQEAGFRAGLSVGPKCVRDRGGVVAEKMFTTERVKPGTSFEEAFRVCRKRGGEFRARKVGSRVFDCHGVFPVPLDLCLGAAGCVDHTVKSLLALMISDPRGLML
jgi:hypothetical protein